MTAFSHRSHAFSPFATPHQSTCTSTLRIYASSVKQVSLDGKSSHPMTCGHSWLDHSCDCARLSAVIKPHLLIRLRQSSRWIPGRRLPSRSLRLQGNRPRSGFPPRVFRVWEKSRDFHAKTHQEQNNTASDTSDPNEPICTEAEENRGTSVRQGNLSSHSIGSVVVC